MSDGRHFTVSAKPSAAWVARQLREAFPFDSVPRFLIRDNDGIFGNEVSRCLSSMHVTEVTTSPGSPWQNAYAERVIGTIRRECLDHVIVLNEAHLHRGLEGYLQYYHEDRLHQGLGRDAPMKRLKEPELGQVVSEPRAGALHHRYKRVA
jgi:putative transposase